MSISTAREKAKMTQEELAKRINVTQGAVAQWESGRTRPRSDTLVRLADILGCTVDELLRGGEQQCQR